MWSTTITIVSALAEPPTAMATPAAAHRIVLAVIGVVAAAMLVAAAYHWRRTGSPAFLLVLAGGYICSFNEALVDVLGHCYFPADGFIAYTTFGRAVPVWVVLAYVVFFGGLTYLQVLWLRSGPSHRAMWAAVGIFWVLNLLLEMPILASGLYVYYGDQPLVIGGFPVIWLVINSLGSLFAAVIITRLSWFFTGVRQLLLVLVPFATYMASWVVTMPHFATTNTDAPTGVRTIAAIVSMALGLVSIDVLIRIGTGQLRLLPPDAALQFADTAVQRVPERAGRRG